MEIDKKPVKQPDYKGDGVAVWINTDKNGKKYLGIRLAGHSTVCAFLNDPKEPTTEPKSVPEERVL